MEQCIIRKLEMIGVQVMQLLGGTTNEGKDGTDECGDLQCWTCWSRMNRVYRREEVAASEGVKVTIKMEIHGCVGLSINLG